VRTWLDFVFLRPRRFVKRYELRRDRYTKPVVFFVDSLLLAGLGLWAVESVSTASGELPGSVQPTVISDGVDSFGIGIIILIFCVVAVFMTFRRARLRPIFNAMAYSSGLLVLLPYAGKIGAGLVASTSIPHADIVVLMWAVLISAIHGLYLAFAVVAFHHVPAKLFLPAVATLVITSGSLLAMTPIDWQINPIAPLLEASDDADTRFDNLTNRSTVVLVNRSSAAPYAEGWKEWDVVSASDNEINVRILYWAPNHAVEDMTVALQPMRIGGGHDTIFMVVLAGARVPQVSRFALVNHVEPSQLTMERLRLYPRGGKTSATGTDSEQFAQITRSPGLSLGTLRRGQWGFIVASFKIHR
jgi:hypothetical protein